MRADKHYLLESQIVADFEKRVYENVTLFEIDGLAFEFNYSSGKTDIIGRTNQGHLIAFEAKLNKWRVALNQAYRNSCFADYSYVILPEASSSKAIKEEHEFIRRGVGLCSIGRAGISIEIEASWKKPLQPWLKESALKHINSREYERERATIIRSCEGNRTFMRIQQR